MARQLRYLFIYALFCEIRADLSYRSDGPNMEIHSLRRMESTPYVMHDGTWYRDMLTIEASKAVANFANQYKPFRFPDDYSYQYQPSEHVAPPQYTHQPDPYAVSYHPDPYGAPYQPQEPYIDNNLDYGVSQYITIPHDLEDQRILADSDEFNIIAAANEAERGTLGQYSNGPYSGAPYSPDVYAYSRPQPQAYSRPPPPYGGVSRSTGYASRPHGAIPSQDFFSTPRKTALHSFYNHGF